MKQIFYLSFHNAFLDLEHGYSLSLTRNEIRKLRDKVSGYL